MLNMTDRYYNRLLQLQQDNSELTFNNDGYQYLKEEIVKKNKLQIDEIENILKITIEDFVEFNNFKKNKKGNVMVRCQCYYDRKNSHFIGVRYYDLDEFKNFEEDENLFE